MGSETIGGFDHTHIPDSEDRAVLQGMPPVKFPVSMPESKRRYHVAAAVPPPFAALISQEAAKAQMLAAGKKRVMAQVKLVQQMTNEQAYQRAVEMGITPTAVPDEIPKVPEFPEVDRGKHGMWGYYGENLGWKHQGVPIHEHVWQVSEKPWLKRSFAPDPALSSAEMHRRRLLEVAAQAGQYEECQSMEMEEQLTRSAADQVAKPPRKGTGHFRNIHPNPEGTASKWNNPVEQCIEPE